MVGVTEVSILYLIANSIKISCDYCIFTGNAVPLNKCYRKLEDTQIYNSYKYICNDNGILQLDYKNLDCSGDFDESFITNIIQYGCYNNNFNNNLLIDIIPQQPSISTECV